MHSIALYPYWLGKYVYHQCVPSIPYMPRDFEVQGLFQYKDHLFRYMIPIIMVRQSWDCLIFIIGISRLVRWHHYIETAPRLVRKLIEKFRGLHHGREHSLACHRFISSCWPVVEKYQPEGFTFCVMIFSLIYIFVTPLVESCVSWKLKCTREYGN